MKRKNRDAKHNGRVTVAPPPKRPHVVVSWLHDSTTEGKFTDSLFAMLLFDAEHGRLIIDPPGGQLSLESGPRVAEARSQLVDAFISEECYRGAEWMLMLDADMTFDPDLPYRLLEHAHPETAPIVGGLCFAGGVNGLSPTLYRVVGAGHELERIWDYPRDALVPVDATGAACLLIHKSVFARMKQPYPQGYGTKHDGVTPNPYPWFVEGLISPRGGAYGEDVAFCLRARQMGLPIFVHTGVRLGHVKKFELTESLYDGMGAAERAQPDQTFVVIAGKNRHDMTQQVLYDLAAQTLVPDKVVLIDNESDPPYDGNLVVPEHLDVDLVVRKGANLSDHWNIGISRASDAARLRPHNIAILNNDLRLDPHFLERLRLGLRHHPDAAIVYPDWAGEHGVGERGTLPIGECVATEGPAPADGMSGWAFMLRGEAGYRLDPQFAWWYGDTDIEHRVRHDGHTVLRVGGAWCTHLDAVASSLAEDKQALIRADEARFLAKWPQYAREPVGA